MKIKKALFKFNDFCNANRIEYMVTGTTALAMLGVLSNPQDIDVKVFHLKEEQEAKLKELQFRSGPENENYEERRQVLLICNWWNQDKMKFKKDKDRTYMLNLIANLVSL